MGVAPLAVVLVAAGIALLLSVFPFRVGPDSIHRLFFRRDGDWRAFGRGIWLLAIATLLIIALWATPTAVRGLAP